MNGGNGNLVAVTPQGRQVVHEEIGLSTPGGAAVGLNGRSVYYVNDGNNKLYELS